MAMFDDPKKELKKLEQQLLKEEEWLDRELAAAKALIGEGPGKKSRKPAPAGKPMEQTQVYRKPGAAPSRTGNQVRNQTADHGKTAKVSARNIPDYDLDEAEQSMPRKSNRGLVILAILETLGIVGVIAYWLIFLL